MMARLARFRRDVQGVAAVEFALAAPVLLLTLLVSVDFALAYNQQMRLSQLVHFGTQFVAQQSGTITPASVQSAILTFQPMSGATVVVGNPVTGCLSSAGLTTQSSGNCPDGTRVGTYVTITASAAYTPLFNTFFSGRFNQSQTETVRVR